MIHIDNVENFALGNIFNQTLNVNVVKAEEAETERGTEKETPASEEVAEAKEEVRGNTPIDTKPLLRNDCFNAEILGSNVLLWRLHNVVAEGIGVGKENCIDLSRGLEWYWLYAALLAAGMLETRNNHEGCVTDSRFVRQMADWFPELVGECDEERIRKLCRSISNERHNWTMNGKELSLVDLHANRRRITSMKRDKIDHIINVAYIGLCVPLMALREESQQESSAR